MQSTSNSDLGSDSDLDFLDSIQTSPVETLDSIRSKLWQKSGENDILRKKLDTLESEHQKGVSVLLQQQSQARNELELRINQLQQQINNEKVRTQFSAAEMMLSRTQPPRALEKTQAYLDSKQKRTAELFGDGFQLKKPRIVPHSSARTVPKPAPLNAATNVQTNPAATSIDNSNNSTSLNNSNSLNSAIANPSFASDSPKGVLLSFLLSHVCFGCDEGTLQLLYKVAYNNSSVGQDLCNAGSVDDFVLRVVNHLSLNLANPELCVILLSLLYEFLIRVGVQFEISDSTKSLCVTGVLRACSEWSKLLTLFPSFDALDTLYLVSIPNVWILEAVLYSLDTLIASQHRFSIPFDLVKELLESQSPEICRQVFDLLTSNAVCEIRSLDQISLDSKPRKYDLRMLSELANIISFQLPTDFDDSPAVLFSGPANTYLENQVTAASFLKRPTYSLHETRLAKDSEQLEVIKEYCQEKKAAEIMRIHAVALDLARFVVMKLCEEYKKLDQPGFLTQIGVAHEPVPTAMHLQSHENRNSSVRTSSHGAGTSVNNANNTNIMNNNATAMNGGNTEDKNGVPNFSLAQNLPQTIRDIDKFALMTFIGFIDYHIVTKTEIVEKAVYYFWVRDYTSLKESLNAVENDMAELCLCLSKIVYENEQDKAREKSNVPDDIRQIAGCESNAVEQARQLLQVLSSSYEIDKIFRVFEIQ